MKNTTQVQGGYSANRTGSSAEVAIAAVLENMGATVITQMPVGNSIYGHTMRCDIFAKGIKGFEDGLIIESKHQGAPGSVDEKFPYLVENIKCQFPNKTIVVISGDGAKAGAIEWLKDQVDDKLIGVFDLGEFITWVSKL